MLSTCQRFPARPKTKGAANGSRLAILSPRHQRPGRPAENDVAIEAWINGSGLDQTVASQLRPIIFGAIADAIDWDMLGLAKASFVGKTRAFQTNSISFERQTTQVRQDLQVKIQIPGDL